MKAKFKVRQDLAFWAGSSGKFEPGEEHEVSGSDKEMAEIQAAGAAGSLVDVEFDGKADFVESDSTSLKKLQQAMGDIGEDGRYTGPWMEGHLDQLQRDLAASEIEIG